METTPRSRFTNTTVTALIGALIGALALGLIGAAIAVIVIASGMNTATSSPAQKDWFPIVASFWGVVAGIVGAVSGALLGCGTGIVISRAAKKRATPS